MSNEAGILLPIGIGLGIGLTCGPGWAFLVVGAAFILSVMHVATRSANYRSYLSQRGLEAGKPSLSDVLAYAGMQFILTAITIGVVAFIVFLARNFWTR